MVVVTRQPDYAPEGVQVAHSVDEALALARGDDEVFIAGGADLYAQTLDALAAGSTSPRIERDFPGDTYFPERGPLRLAARRGGAPPGAETLPYAFLTYER